MIREQDSAMPDEMPNSTRRFTMWELLAYVTVCGVTLALILGLKNIPPHRLNDYGYLDIFVRMIVVLLIFTIGGLVGIAFTLFVAGRKYVRTGAVVGGAALLIAWMAFLIVCVAIP